MEPIFFWLVPLIASVAFVKGGTEVLPGIQASLVMEKQQYLIGEPIMLMFRVRDTGTAPISLPDSDPYGRCSGYQIAIDPKEPSREPESGPPCAPLFTIEEFHCLTGGLNLVPGRDVEQRILLNRFQSFTQPGTYTITATKHLSDFKSWGKQNQPTGQVSGTFTINIIAPHSSDDLKAAFSPYVEDLRTSSYERRHEAAIAIATLPAPFLEPSLLQMLSIPDLQADAIRGLQRLNTKGARTALFDFIRKDDSFTTNQQLALQALGEMNDAAYGPPLLALWRDNRNTERKAKLLVTAARLDPTIAMPIIQSFLQSSKEKDREEGANALAATERPEVLTLLVQGLTDSSLRVRQAAAHALVSLTRKTPSKDGLTWSGADPATDADYWSSWLRNNPALPIHPIRECPQMLPQ